MCKSIMILLPYIRCQNEVQGCNWLSPGKLVCYFQPFCMLCCHRIYNTDKCFVRSKETMTSGKKISFQPCFTHMLRKHTIHDTSIQCKVVIITVHICIPRTILNFECMIQTVRHRFVRSENTEVFIFFIQCKDVTHISTKLNHILCLSLTRNNIFYTILTEIWETKIFQKKTTVCMWVSTHTSISLRSHINDLLFYTSVFIEEFFRFVTKHPFSQLIQMLWFFH